MRQMELVNKFDNALSGVAGDNGAIGAAVNAANFLETGSFWDMRHCEPADGETRTTTNQLAAPDIGGRAAGRAVRRDRPALRRCQPAGPAALPAAATTATPAA